MLPIFLKKADEPRWFFVLKIIGVAFLGILGVGALAILFGYIVMWLWNWLLPGLFGLSTITFWQGVGIVILARIIFGSFNHQPHRFRPRAHPFKNAFTGKFSEQWEYYSDYWKEEGEMAFKAYVARKKQNPS
jgi:hypothetical protein